MENSANKTKISSLQKINKLTGVNCSIGATALNGYKQFLLLCSLNTRSVCNKTDHILDYVCDCKADLLAFRQTWLTREDSAVRVNLCPGGYKFIHQCRAGRCGGGTGLMFCDLLNVKKVDRGEHDSYEFLEWLVSKSSSNKLRVDIIYRPPYTEEHPMTVTNFCNEFARYMESLLLSKEQLVMLSCG
ncbi:Hypothetical predicted protein [Paramuricea clavata]|uniref:Uncharacterized protein n=1 Tax=Paramuricea clavata TaxID=317549 RepID=A0A6S7H3V3_PARCT|nr:Hypothetical predicted protein [Paramuricea clavata]